jgi:hypothetical protein
VRPAGEDVHHEGLPGRLHGHCLLNVIDALCSAAGIPFTVEKK